jgi:hypothetical protein
MSSPNINLILQATLAVLNVQVSPSVQMAVMDFSNPTLPSGAAVATGGLQFSYDAFFQALNTGSSFPLPASKVFAILVQNLSPTAVLQVAHTPFGGSASTSSYGPGGVFVVFDPTETGVGFSALTLTGVGGTVPCQVLVGY